VRNILIVGATSAMAESAARRYAERGDTLYLVARDASRLAAIADDLRVRGAAAVYTAPFRAEEYAAHGPLVEDVWRELGKVDVALVAHGVLPDQAACDRDPQTAIASLEPNAISVASILGWLANRFEAQGHGTIGIVSSVAGDRGRKSNYVYGAAKALVSTYANGLRHRLHDRNVRVTLIKPGFVTSPMTAKFPKGPLWISADQAGRLIVRAMDRGVSTAYVPGFWRWIMVVVRALPERLFLRTNL
jgi:short-subunit dehydrogenase